MYERLNATTVELLIVCMLYLNRISFSGGTCVLCVDAFLHNAQPCLFSFAVGSGKSNNYSGRVLEKKTTSCKIML